MLVGRGALSQRFFERQGHPFVQAHARAPRGKGDFLVQCGIRADDELAGKGFLWLVAPFGAKGEVVFHAFGQSGL